MSFPFFLFLSSSHPFLPSNGRCCLDNCCNVLSGSAWKMEAFPTNLQSHLLCLPCHARAIIDDRHLFGVLYNYCTSGKREGESESLVACDAHYISGRLVPIPIRVLNRPDIHAGANIHDAFTAHSHWWAQFLLRTIPYFRFGACTSFTSSINVIG